VSLAFHDGVTSGMAIALPSPKFWVVGNLSVDQLFVGNFFYHLTRNILDCDLSSVLLTHIIFSCIF